MSLWMAALSTFADCAATTLALIWVRVSVTVCEADRATLVVAWPKEIASDTALKPAMSARRPWAMAKVEASSLALATFRPELIRPWADSSALLVALRVWMAAKAAALVLTENDMVFSFWIS